MTSYIMQASRFEQPEESMPLIPMYVRSHEVPGQAPWGKLSMSWETQDREMSQIRRA